MSEKKPFITEKEEEGKGLSQKYLSFFRKPDIFDLLTYLFIIFWVIAFYQNITLIVSPDTTIRNQAFTMFGIGIMGVGGASFKSIFDNSIIKLGNKLLDTTITTTVFERLDRHSLSGIMQTGIWFAINFGITSLLSFIIFQLPFSTFGLFGTNFTFAVISSVGEELLFTYFLLPVLMSELGIAGVPVNIGVFTLYHYLVYQQPLQLIYIAIIRTVYSVTYIFHRRLSPSIMAHFLNNFLVAIRI